MKTSIISLLTILAFFLLFGEHVAAQNSATAFTSWGDPVQDVQLSISMSNTFITVSSKTSLLAEIKNSSTNIVEVIISDPLVNDFTVFLTDSKHSYIIAEPSGAVSGIMPPVFISPGESRRWVVVLNIGNNIEPGAYTIKANRHFKISGRDLKLVSNALEVKLK